MRIGFVLIIMLSLNLFLMLFQTSIDHIILDEGATVTKYYDAQGNILSTVMLANGTVMDANKADDLPTTVKSDVSGGGFSDLFNSFLDWIGQNVPGAKMMFDMVNAVPKFLALMFPGVPEITGAIGAMWHLLTLFLLISWLRWNF